MEGAKKADPGRSYGEMHDGRFLRLMRPRQAYWHRTFACPSALYRATAEVVFIVVDGATENLQGLWPEIMWLYPEEIQLLGAIALAVPEGCGTLGFTPADERHRVDQLEGPLDNPAIQDQLTDYAADCAASLEPAPRLFELRDAEGSEISFQKRLFEGVNLANPLVVRGLGTLLKSQHVFGVSRLLAEDATINVQIAREAALEIIRDRLRPAIKDPSYADAHEYLRGNFRFGEALADYFEDQHDLWVTAKHPRNRHGMFWTPPMTADDYFETYEALVSVYRHLLTGENGRETACA